MFKNKIFFLTFSIFLSINSIDAQVRRYSNDYLNIGISAKNMALGNSVVANVNDYSSAYYNPAGLALLSSKYTGSIMHSEYYSGIAKYDFAGFSYKYDDSLGFAVSFIRLGIDDIQNTLFLFDQNGQVNYDNIELFSVADYATLLSFGRESRIKRLYYGGTVKLIFRSEGKFAKAFGFGLDAGVQYFVGKYKIGANLLNATSTFTAWFFKLSDEMIQVFEDTGNEIPKNSIELTMPILNSGISRTFKISDKTSLLSEFDLNFTFDGKRNALVSFNPVSFYPQIGFEFNYNKIVFVRAGVNNFQLIPDFAANADTSGNYFRDNRFEFVPSVGLGFVYKKLHIDYALTNFGNIGSGLYSHIFSVSYKFD